MEIFIRSLASYVAAAGGRADIDLIVAHPDYDTAVEASLEFFKKKSLKEFLARNVIARKVWGTDPLSGFTVNLNDEMERNAFANLAPRSIHAEAWIGEVEVLFLIESDRSVLVDLESSVIDMLVSEARSEHPGISIEKVTPRR